ncbi:hypothetical protein CDL60_26915 [Roseateles noduli]|nr:hypothetical protein CDL60_26915 [Roseateles noduli]
MDDLRAAFGLSSTLVTPQRSASTNPESASVDLRGLTADVATLRNAGDPEMHRRLHAWLSSLERRLGQADLRPAARRALSAEVLVLDLETRLAKKYRGARSAGRPAARRSDVDDQHLLRARLAFGEALLDQLECGILAPEAIWDHLGRSLLEDPPAGEAALNALHALRGTGDARQQRLASEVCRRLAGTAQRLQAADGASAAARDAPRMPNDCLMHLSCIVDDVLARHPGDQALRKLSQAVKHAFLAHDGPLTALEALVPEASARFRQLEEPDAAKRCLHLLEQLPAENHSGEIRLNRLQLHDNPYGRAFDSLFAAELVKTPPPGMLSAVGSLSQALAGQLRDTTVMRQAAESLRHGLRKDPRAWQSLVPGCQRFIAAPKGQALEALASFLRTPPQDGPDAMAKLYLATYLGEKQRHAAGRLDRPQDSPRHLEQSAGTYGFITEQRAREAPGNRAGTAHTRGTGILLRHQPAATDEARLLPAHRPSTLYRVGTLSEDEAKRAQGRFDYSRSVDLQHGRGLPYGSGVSGSTNMLLHLYAELRDQGLTRAPARDVLLACATLMNYDGGHAIHEAVWTGNLLDPELGLGLGLDDEAAPPQEFVLDHNAFVEGFDGPTRDALRRATDRAWSGTQDYLRTHSHFAREAT